MHTPSEIGVTRHRELSSLSSLRVVSHPNVDNHRVLNKQVLFNNLRSPLDGSVVDAALSKRSAELLPPNQDTPPPPSKKDAVAASPTTKNKNKSTECDYTLEINNYVDGDDNGDHTEKDFRAYHTHTPENVCPNQNPNQHSSIPVNECVKVTNIVPPYPVPVFTSLTTQLVAKVELLNILQKNNLPMNTFKNVMDWTYRQNVRQHVLQQGNDRNVPTPRTRSTALIDICNYIPPIYFSFHAHGLNWLPDNKLVQVYVRSFRQALFSLLTNPCLVKEDNFSFPLNDTPFLPADFNLDEKVPITELHHG